MPMQCMAYPTNTVKLKHKGLGQKAKVLFRRVARIWKRGGYFERVRSVHTTLTRIFIDLESVSDGLSEIWDEMSRKHRKYKGFFRPKLGDLQKKKKKKKKKKKVFAKIQSDFSPKFRKFKRLRGALFVWGGAIFHFFTENRPQKHKIHAFLHTSQANGGARAPPAPPWLRYWSYSLFPT